MPKKDKKVKKEKSKPNVDPLAALTNSFQMVEKIGGIFQSFQQNTQQGFAPVHYRPNASVTPVPSAQSVPRPSSVFDTGEREQLLSRVKELEQLNAEQQAGFQQSEAEAWRLLEQQRLAEQHLRQQHEMGFAAAAAEAEATKARAEEVAEAARLEAEATEAAAVAAESELRAAQAKSALQAHMTMQEDALRRERADADRSMAEEEAKVQRDSEMSELKETISNLEAKNTAMTQLIKAKNEIVWALLEQQQELKTENEAHCTNFEAYQSKCQEEFKGWIELNDKLDAEIGELKRADMENRLIIKRMHEEIEKKWEGETSSNARIAELEAMVIELKRENREQERQQQ